MSPSQPSREPIVELQPRRQPGRTDRKAAGYAVQIARLRSTGFTYEAIREALADVGIELSTSALRREVRRLHMRTNSVRSGTPSGPHPASQAPAHPTPASSSVSPPHPAAPADSNGHDIAEAFFISHPSNPLLRSKEIP